MMRGLIGRAAGLAFVATLSAYGTALADIDTDGVADSIDNCTAIWNPLQVDSDLDGFGNRCDSDFDNNLAVNFADFSAFQAVYAQSVPPADPKYDLDSQGSVGFSDFSMFASMLFLPVGPSGLPCSGVTTPCTASTVNTAPVASVLSVSDTQPDGSQGTVSILGSLTACNDDGLPSPPGLCLQSVIALEMGKTCDSSCNCNGAAKGTGGSVVGGQWQISGLAPNTEFVLFGKNTDGALDTCSTGSTQISSLGDKCGLLSAGRTRLS